MENKSSLICKNIRIDSKRTSVRLEGEMWAALRDIARRERCTMHDLCTLISLRKRPVTSLTAAIRVFLMLYYRSAATEEGHVRAGHGSFEQMPRRARAKLQEKPDYPPYIPVAKVNINADHRVGLR